MEPIVFLQSGVKDPYSIYEARLRENPVHKDPVKALWGIYGYEECQTFLSHPSTAIPDSDPNNTDGLNEYAWLIRDHLVRISNPPRHEIARWAGIHLMTQMTKPSIPRILSNLLRRPPVHNGIDWVEEVAKRLPMALMLQSFAFKEDDSEYITTHLGALTKILSPERTKEQVAVINNMATELFSIVRHHILATPPYLDMANALSRGYHLDEDTSIAYIVSNLIGLFIQGYDACRGLLCNGLLSILRENSPQQSRSGFSDRAIMTKWIIETLRFDPTVHNTRRVVTSDISFRGQEIKKDDTLFIVLAAANWDPKKFDRPSLFDIERKNNDQYMTLGYGPHSCLGKYFAVQLTTDTLACFFERYSKIRWLETELVYEPLVNIRMPKRVMIDWK